MTKEKEVKELHYGGDSGFPPRRRRRRPIREPRRRPFRDPRRRPPEQLGPDDRPLGKMFPLTPDGQIKKRGRNPRRRPPTTGDQSRKAMEEFNKRMRQQLLRSRGNNQSISATPATQKPRLPRNVRSLDQTFNPRRRPTATPRPSGRMVANGGVITKNRIGANDFREGGYVLSTVDNRKNKK